MPGGTRLNSQWWGGRDRWVLGGLLVIQFSLICEFQAKSLKKQIKSGVDGWLTLYGLWALNSGHQTSATRTSDC